MPNNFENTDELKWRYRYWSVEDEINDDHKEDGLPTPEEGTLAREIFHQNFLDAKSEQSGEVIEENNEFEFASYEHDAFGKAIRQGSNIKITWDSADLKRNPDLPKEMLLNHFETYIRVGGIEIQNSSNTEHNENNIPEVTIGIFRGQKGLVSSEAKKIFGELKDHTEVFTKETFLSGNDDHMNYMIIEDKGTTGLNGDYYLHNTPNSVGKRSEDYYYFVRNMGRTGKGKNDGGSQGIGKISLYLASKIRAILIASSREQFPKNNEKNILIGKAIMPRSYKLSGDNRDLKQQLHYSLINTTNENKAKHIPSTDIDGIKNILNKFNSSRKISNDESSENGLTLIIPDPEELYLEPENLKYWVLMNSFSAIARGDMKVKLNIDGEVKLINSSNIEEEVGSLREEDINKDIKNLPKYIDKESLIKQVALAKKLTSSDTEFIKIGNLKASGNVNNHLKDSILNLEELDQLKKNYMNGDELAFQFDLKIKEWKAKSGGRKKTNVESKSSYVAMIIQRDENLEKFLPVYLRRDIRMIKQWTSRSNLHLNFIMEPQQKSVLEKMLRDTENEGHDRWQLTGRGMGNLRFFQQDSTERRWGDNYKDVVTMLRDLPQTLKDILEDYSEEIVPVYGDLISELNDEGNFDGTVVITDPKPKKPKSTVTDPAGPGSPREHNVNFSQNSPGGPVKISGKTYQSGRAFEGRVKIKKLKSIKLIFYYDTDESGNKENKFDSISDFDFNDPETLIDTYGCDYKIEGSNTINIENFSEDNYYLNLNYPFSINKILCFSVYTKSIKETEIKESELAK